jgi:hypothetical protein
MFINDRHAVPRQAATGATAHRRHAAADAA